MVSRLSSLPMPHPSHAVHGIKGEPSCFLIQSGKETLLLYEKHKLSVIA